MRISNENSSLRPTVKDTTSYQALSFQLLKHRIPPSHLTYCHMLFLVIAKFASISLLSKYFGTASMKSSFIVI